MTYQVHQSEDLTLKTGIRFNTTTRRVMEQEDKPIYTPEGACGRAYAFWGIVAAAVFFAVLWVLYERGMP